MQALVGFSSVQIEKEFIFFFLHLFMGRCLILLKIYSFYCVLIQASKTMAHFEFRPNTPAMAWHSFLLVEHTA